MSAITSFSAWPRIEIGEPKGTTQTVMSAGTTVSAGASQ